MSITLSDSAAARVNAFTANRGKGFGLRTGVEPPAARVWPMYWSLLTSRRLKTPCLKTKA